MNYEYVKIDSGNIGDYTNIWVDVIQMLGSGANFDRALQMIKQNKANFLEIEDMYKTSNKRLDYHHFIRVLELDGKPVAFLNGIVRYFKEGIFIQIGSYGTIRRVQKRGHGAIFWRYIEEELQEKGINLAWGIMQNQGFWEKQGFIYDTKRFLKKYYEISQPEKIFYKKVSNKQNSLEDFMHMFDGEYGIDENIKLHFIPNPNDYS
jgi:GNAT superfamily N-acetyltransferase